MIHVRLMRTDDLPIILDLENKHFNQISEADFMQHYYMNPLIKIYLIEVNKVFVGYLVIWLDIDKYQIYSMYILDSFRRKGYAYQAIQLVESILKKAGVLEASLEVNENNIRAISLYKKLGYKVISIRENYYKNNEKALFMYKLI